MVTNDLEYAFFGMRRGGQHAIIHWLACHFDEPVWFVNDISKFNRPYVPRDDTNVYEPDEFRSPIGVKNFWKIKKKVLFHSYEDKFLSSMDFEKNSKVIGNSARKVSILILRDPFNLFASRIKRGDYVFRITQREVDVWTEHAREAIGVTSYLPNLVVVSFNAWATSEAYRRRLEIQLGLPETEKGRNRIYGVGSSFDGKKLDGQASKMNLLKRWEYVSPSPYFRRLVSKKDMWNLSRTIFGDLHTNVVRPNGRPKTPVPGMLADKRIVFIRTPKTGSTSIKMMLKKYAEECGLKVFYRFHQAIFDKVEDPPYDLSLHHVVYNARNMKRLKRVLPGCVCISSVRDPIEQARSHYHHIGPLGPINRFAANGMSFEEWYVKCKDLEGDYAGWKDSVSLRHWTHNTMATFMGFSDITEVRPNILGDRYAFIFVLEHMELSMRVFSDLLGWKPDTIEKWRVASYDKGEIDEKVRNMFRERNELDYAVYEAATKRLLRQAQELGYDTEDKVHTDEG